MEGGPFTALMELLSFNRGPLMYAGGVALYSAMLVLLQSIQFYLMTRYEENHGASLAVLALVFLPPLSIVGLYLFAVTRNGSPVATLVATALVTILWVAGGMLPRLVREREDLEAPPIFEGSATLVTLLVMTILSYLIL